MSRDRKTDAHRLAGERKAGRTLGPDDIVHHVDEDKANNAPVNLDTSKTRGQHTADHNRGRRVSKLRDALRMHRDGRKLY